MIEMVTAYTLEVDDKEYALGEILEQLDLENNQQKYSAGIMLFHPDYIATGTAQEIAEKLPFDVVGCTTLANLTSEMDDSLMLSISMYTSNDVEFSSFILDNPEDKNALSSAYDEVKQGDKAGLVVSFISLRSLVPHEEIVTNMDIIMDNPPIFGVGSIDHTSDLSACYVLRNGEISQTGMTALMFWGEVNPVFSYSEMSKDSIQRQEAVVTKSEGKMIIEVNNASFREFLKTIGFADDASVEELGSVPLIVDYNDGTTPVACGLQGITEEGYGVVGISIPEGATLSIGSVERGDVLRLTEETMKKVLRSDKRQGMILAPCASHYLVLGANAQDQKDIIMDMTKGVLPYHLCYAGGEICPAYDKDGNIHNRFHNYTFVACAF